MKKVKKNKSDINANEISSHIKLDQRECVSTDDVNKHSSIWSNETLCNGDNNEAIIEEKFDNDLEKLLESEVVSSLEKEKIVRKVLNQIEKEKLENDLEKLFECEAISYSEKERIIRRTLQSITHHESQPISGVKNAFEVTNPVDIINLDAEDIIDLTSAEGNPDKVSEITSPEIIFSYDGIEKRNEYKIARSEAILRRQYNEEVFWRAEAKGRSKTSMRNWIHDSAMAQKKRSSTLEQSSRSRSSRQSQNNNDLDRPKVLMDISKSIDSKSSNSTGELKIRSPKRSNKPFDPRDEAKVSQCLGVFNLSLGTKKGDLEDKFGKYGKLKKVALVTDRWGDPRGYAFITFEHEEDATKAKEALNATEFHGRTIRVDYSRTLKAHPRTPGMFRGRATESYKWFRERTRSRERDRGSYSKRLGERGRLESKSEARARHREERRRKLRDMDLSWRPRLSSVSHTRSRSTQRWRKFSPRSQSRSRSRSAQRRRTPSPRLTSNHDESKRQENNFNSRSPGKRLNSCTINIDEESKDDISETAAKELGTNSNAKQVSPELVVVHKLTV